MIEIFINPETDDIELDNTGDLVMTDQVPLQNTWQECKVQRGSDLFNDFYGIPYFDFNVTGLTQAAQNLLISNVRDIARKYNFITQNISLNRVEDTEIVVDISYEYNDKDETMTITF